MNDETKQRIATIASEARDAARLHRRSAKGGGVSAEWSRGCADVFEWTVRQIEDAMRREPEEATR